MVLFGQTGLPLYISALAVLGVNRFFLSAVSAGTPHVVSHDKLVMANAVVAHRGHDPRFVGGVVGLGVHFISGGGLPAARPLWFGGACYLVAGLLGTRMDRNLLGPLEAEKAERRRRRSADLGGVVRGLVADSGTSTSGARPPTRSAWSACTARSTAPCWSRRYCSTGTTSSTAATATRPLVTSRCW